MTLNRALPMEAQEAPAALHPLNHKHKWRSTNPVYIGDTSVRIYTVYFIHLHYPYNVFEEKLRFCSARRHSDQK